MALVAMAIMLLAPVVESNAQISRDYRHSESYQDAVNRAADGIKGLFSKKGSKKKSDKSQDKNASSPAAQSRDLQKDEIKLVVSGDGATKDQATRSALRSAIEQTYGTFVSSNTVILNDELVKDEIATVASGNIKSFNYISENEKDGKYYVTLETVVSIGKLISYAKSKGSEAELAGATFAMDIKMKKLNEKNQNIALQNMVLQWLDIAGKSLDYDIVVQEPKANEYNEKGYEVGFTIIVKANKNLNAAQELFHNTLQSLSLTPSEAADYKSKNLPTGRFGGYILRGVNNRTLSTMCLNYLQKSFLNFTISDGLKEYYVRDDYNRGDHDYNLYDKSREGKLFDLEKPYMIGDIENYGILYAQEDFTGKEVFKLKGPLYYTLAEIEKLKTITVHPNSPTDKGDIVSYINKLRDPLDIDHLIECKSVPLEILEAYKKDKDAVISGLLEMYDAERVKKLTQIMDDIIKFQEERNNAKNE